MVRCVGTACRAFLPQDISLAAAVKLQNVYVGIGYFVVGGFGVSDYVGLNI